MNTKYILTSELRKPMIFSILACAELYKIIYGGVIYKIQDGELSQ